MDWRVLVSVDPHVMHGTACFTGTRVPVSEEHVRAATAYAAELAHERTRPLSA